QLSYCVLAYYVVVSVTSVLWDLQNWCPWGSTEAADVYIRIKDDEWNVYRRYTEFRALHHQLQSTFPQVRAYNFPPKKAIGNKWVMLRSRDPKDVKDPTDVGDPTDMDVDETVPKLGIWHPRLRAIQKQKEKKGAN
ncbi:hypothetical protein A6R68_07699, partial [Neotoma lepida]